MQKEGQEGHLCARHKLDKHGHFNPQHHCSIPILQIRKQRSREQK